MDSSDDEMFLLEVFELPRKERTILPRANPFTDLDDEKFKERFRLNKSTVLKILEELETNLEYSSDRNQSVSPINQLLISIRFLATGTFQLIVGELFGIDKSTACRIIHKVLPLIAQMSAKYIKFPENQADRHNTMLKFHDNSGFPGVLGAIDGTHVPISSPGGEDPEVYRNRKGYFSINVQIITEPDLYITDIVSRWPGSVHDSTIFNFSHKKALFASGQIQDGYLIGESGYACTRYLLTPLLNPVTPGEIAYNKCHVQTRNCVERVNGVLKRRFASLKHGLRVNLSKIPTTIVAAAVLHNVARVMGDDDPPEDKELELFLQQQRLNGIQVDFEVLDEILPPNTMTVPGSTGQRSELILNYFS